MPGDEKKLRILETCKDSLLDMALDQYAFHILALIVEHGSVDCIETGLKDFLIRETPTLMKNNLGVRLLSKVIEKDKLKDFTELYVRIIN